MRIVHVIARLNDGGPARVLSALVPALTAAGHDVTIVAGATAADEPDLTPQLRAAGLQIVTVAGLGRRVALIDDVVAAGRLWRVVRQLRPDVVHTHTAKAGVLGRLAAWSLGLRTVHTFHGHVFRGYFGHAATRCAVSVERILASRGHLQALTQTQFQDLHQRYHLGRAWQWSVLPVPVPPLAVNPRQWHDSPCIGYLGRVVAVKDPELWLAVFRTVLARRPVRGVIAGDGPLRADLAAASADLPIEWVGFQPAATVLARLDVLLMTSRNEGQPLVAIEAVGAGVPVVAPLVGGLVDLHNAGVVQGVERTVVALADAVCAALDGPAPDPALVRGYRMEALLPRYLALYGVE